MCICAHVSEILQDADLTGIKTCKKKIEIYVLNCFIIKIIVIFYVKITLKHINIVLTNNSVLIIFLMKIN
jgi:hypothetical protein